MGDQETKVTYWALVLAQAMTQQPPKWANLPRECPTCRLGLA